MLKPVLAAAALLGMLALPACGNKTADAPEAAATPDFVWAQEVSDLPADPAVRFGQLDNGMRYAILKNSTPPDTAAMRMRFDVGSLYEADDQQGLAHFIEHMAFNGSTNVPEGEMVKLLERYGLAFGPDTNAYTSFDETVYQLDLPNVDEDTLNTGLFIMRETAGNLLFEPDAVDRERGVVLSEERVRNTYGLRRIVDLLGFAAPDSLLPNRLPIGLVEVLENAPPERLADLYNRYYVPDRATLIVVGDVDVDAIEAKIKETFSDWAPKGEVGDDPELGTVDPKRATDAHYFYDPDVPAFVSVAGVKQPVTKLDTAAKRKDDLVRSLGNAILSRRFEKIARLSDSPIISGGASYDEWYDALEGPSIDLTAKEGEWRDALKLAEVELRRALEYGFTQAELDEQIAGYRSALKNDVAEAATRSNASLANQIAGAVNADRVFTTPQSSLDRFEEAVAGLTPDMVSAAFKAQWDGVNPLIHVSDNVELEGAREEILSIWNDSAATEVTPPEDAGSGAFAYTDFGTPGKVAADGRIEDLDIRTIRFENNVLLNLKKTDFEDGVVRISLRMGGGELEMPLDKDGLNLVFSFLGEAGLGEHSIDELQTILAGRTVDFGFGAGEDSFGASYRTTPEDMLLQLQIAMAYLTDPGLRPETETLAKAQLRVFYPTLKGSPSGVAQRDVARIIRSGDIRYGIGPLDEILKRSFDEVRPILARVAAEGAIEIGIVGDFDEQAAIDAVAATFGALPPRPVQPLAFADKREVSFPEDRTPITLTHGGKEYQALAQVYWPGVDGSDISRTRKINALRAVLDLKATDELREALGATYSPGVGASSSDVYPGYGYIVVSSEVRPELVDTVYETVDAMVADVLAGNVTDDDVLRAMKPIVESIETQEEQNGYWLGVVSEAQTHPDYLDRHRSRKAEYAGMTVEDVLEAAHMIFDGVEPLRIRIIQEDVAAAEGE